DLELIRKIEESEIPYWYPTDRMPEGDESRRNDPLGITHVHHFYTRRNLWALSCLYHHGKKFLPLLLIIQSISATLCSKLARYNLGNRGNGPVSGTLYIASLVAEANVTKVFSGKIID